MVSVGVGRRRGTRGSWVGLVGGARVVAVGGRVTARS